MKKPFKLLDSVYEAVESERYVEIIFHTYFYVTDRKEYKKYTKMLIDEMRERGFKYKSNNSQQFDDHQMMIPVPIHFFQIGLTR